MSDFGFASDSPRCSPVLFCQGTHSLDVDQGSSFQLVVDVTISLVRAEAASLPFPPLSLLDPVRHPADRPDQQTDARVHKQEAKVVQSVASDASLEQLRLEEGRRDGSS